MATGDQYHLKAAELHARAMRERKPAVQAELESLAVAYVRLAEQAERNSVMDIAYEPPPLKASEAE